MEWPVKACHLWTVISSIVYYTKRQHRTLNMTHNDKTIDCYKTTTMYSCLPYDKMQNVLDTCEKLL